MKTIRDLWSGRLPLRDALWDWAVFRGVLFNAACTFGMLALALVDEQRTAPLAVAVHLLAVPFNVLVLVGVWRSAGRPAVTPLARDLARVFAGLLFVAYLIV